jgi:branched-chain amino acid transport system permease protein
MKQFNKNALLYLGLLIFGLAAPFIFPAFKLQISFLYILIVLAMTWDVQGGQMGYNTFGNILFFGIGMYVASSTQIAMFFSPPASVHSAKEKNIAI